MWLALAGGGVSSRGRERRATRARLPNALRTTASRRARRRPLLRILSHVKVPRCPVTTDEAPLLYYDVTGEPVPRWAVGVDPDPDERGPLVDYDVVDPPAPET